MRTDGPNVFLCGFAVVVLFCCAAVKESYSHTDSHVFSSSYNWTAAFLINRCLLLTDDSETTLSGAAADKPGNKCKEYLVFKNVNVAFL